MKELQGHWAYGNLHYFRAASPLGLLTSSTIIDISRNYGLDKNGANDLFVLAGNTVRERLGHVDVENGFFSLALLACFAGGEISPFQR